MAKADARADEIGYLIDRAAFDPDRWGEVMSAFAAAVPGGKSGFQVVDVAGERAIPLTAAGWPDGVVEAYAQYYNGINPWMPVMLTAPAMQPIYSERLLPASSFKHTEFYTDWLSRAGGATASTGMRIAERDGRLAFFSFHYDVRTADQANAVYEPLLRTLVPRIRRSLDATCGVTPKRLKDPLLDALVEPALLLGHDLRTYGTNAAADALLRDGHLLRIGARDRLDLRHADLLSCIHTAVSRACAPDTILSPPATVAPVMTDWGAFLPCVLPVDPAFLRAGGMNALVLPRRLALLILRPSAVRPTPADVQDTLRKTYGLTPAEARLAAALDGRASLNEVAERYGITSATARTQLKAIFRKTNTARQAELVRLILQTSGGMGP